MQVHKVLTLKRKNKKKPNLLLYDLLVLSVTGNSPGVLIIQFCPFLTQKYVEKQYETLQPVSYGGERERKKKKEPEMSRLEKCWEQEWVGIPKN